MYVLVRLTAAQKTFAGFPAENSSGIPREFHMGEIIYVRRKGRENHRERTIEKEKERERDPRAEK